MTNPITLIHGTNQHYRAQHGQITVHGHTDPVNLDDMYKNLLITTAFLGGGVSTALKSVAEQWLTAGKGSLFVIDASGALGVDIAERARAMGIPEDKISVIGWGPGEVGFDLLNDLHPDDEYALRGNPDFYDLDQKRPRISVDSIFEPGQLTVVNLPLVQSVGARIAIRIVLSKIYRQVVIRSVTNDYPTNRNQPLLMIVDDIDQLLTGQEHVIYRCGRSAGVYMAMGCPIDRINDVPLALTVAGVRTDAFRAAA
jgi:hypothetical protein